MALVGKRALRGNPKLQPGGGQVLPMDLLEPLLVALCIAIQRIHVPVKVNIFLDVVNSLLEGSDLEKQITDWKVRHSFYKPDPINPPANLGIAYYKGFMNRNSKEIESKSPRNFAADRLKWTTYENVELMYDKVYEAIVEAGAPHFLPEPKWMDETGNHVAEEDAFGLLRLIKTKIVLFEISGNSVVHFLQSFYVGVNCLTMTEIGKLWSSRFAVLSRS
jgi:hypothetical protein